MRLLLIIENSTVVSKTIKDEVELIHKLNFAIPAGHKDREGARKNKSYYRHKIYYYQSF